MTNRYSRTGTALEDGISGTRVMQPANNAIIQTPALPRLSRSNCSADKKAPLEIRRPLLPEPFMRPQAFQPEKTNREASNAAVHFRKQAPQEKAFRTPWARAGLRFYGTGRLGSLQSGIIHLNSQPEHADSHQAENAGSGDGKNVHCQLPPLRLFPASTNQRPQRAADGTGANAPLFFPGGLSSGIQVGPHHHGMRKWLRLHYGKV